MEMLTLADIKGKLYNPPPSSHKGQNGKLLLIGGSQLFHAASLWALRVASRIVDMVYYASVPENNQIVLDAKEAFYDGIVIRREHIGDYIAEADCILIGPGLPREDGVVEGDDDTLLLTTTWLKQFPQKRWVIDGGSLQVINPSLLPETAIITPHHREFQKLFRCEANADHTKKMAETYGIVIVSKGEEDIVCSPTECWVIGGGNSGMTKGGTGDVLAGLIAALYCKNDAWLSALAGCWINKRAGEEMYKRAGYYYNATDLVEEIPHIMKDLL